MSTVCSWFVLSINYLEKFHQSLNYKTLTSTETQLLTILIVFDINSNIPPIQLLTKKAEGTSLSARALV
jgi:hypothetical protein